MSTPTPDAPDFHPPPSPLLAWALRACGLVSLAAFAGIAWLAVAKLSPAAPQPGAFARGAVLVLAAAAVGFTTNWLAIRMLFRPRVRKPWLVFWQQGLLPREQARFAAALGRVAADRLLSPDAIADALSDERLRKPLGDAMQRELQGLLESPGARSLLSRYVAEALRSQGPATVRQLRPQLRAAIEGLLDEYITSERVLAALEAAVFHFARNRDMRRALARWIFRETTRDGVVRRVMDALREQFFRYRERHPLRGFIAEQFVIDWDEVRRSLVATLRSEEMTEDAAEMLLEMAGSIAGRLREPGMAEGVAEGRRRVVERLLDWFEQEGVPALAKRAEGLADDPAVWEFIERSIEDLAARIPALVFQEDGAMRPEIRARLEDLQRRLVDVFPVADVVERQVLAMDPARLEALVDEVGRRELAWIQILGLVLGAMAGGALAILL